jgi:DHA1 family multidrug resistance protein-like MFS transporter
VGQIIYRLSGGKIFSYPEERDGFELPEKYRSEKDKPSRFGREERQDEGDRRASDSAETVVAQRSNSNSGEGKKNEKKNKDGEDEHIMVDWYSEDDPENPQNWYVPLFFPCSHSLSFLVVAAVANN